MILPNRSLMVALAAFVSAAGMRGLPAPVARPVAGQLFAADETVPSGMRVYVRGATWADSADADSAGAFALAVPADADDDSVEMRITAADPADRRFYPAVARLARTDLTRKPRFVLVPRLWTVRGGVFDGAKVDVRLDRAFEADCRDCSSFYARRWLRGDRDPQGLASWPEKKFPLRVAFDRDYSAERITARDSAAFWGGVRGLEDDLGAHLFRPVPFSETLPQGDGPDDVILVWIEPTMRFAGLGNTVSGAPGNISYGSVQFKHASLLAGPNVNGLVGHEMLHTLGIGHTCAWPSVMADATRCPSLKTETLTPDDVAHAQLFLRVSALRREHGARWGIEAAYLGALPNSSAAHDAFAARE